MSVATAMAPVVKKPLDSVFDSLKNILGDDEPVNFNKTRLLAFHTARKNMVYCIPFLGKSA